jgi:hypothetical protein
MHTHFRCIDTIDAHLYAPGCVQYTITALLPRYRINNTLLLCDNHELLPHTWYNKTLVELIPPITTAHPLDVGTAPHGLWVMAQKLSSDIVDQYTIVWNNDTETVLKHKTYTDFTITCNSSCIAQTILYAHCHAIYNHLKQNGLSCKTAPINADIRFTNQIVIHADRGGTVHG